MKSFLLIIASCYCILIGSASLVVCDTNYRTAFFFCEQQ